VDIRLVLGAVAAEDGPHYVAVAAGDGPHYNGAGKSRR
jgi:hypothetical protein